MEVDLVNSYPKEILKNSLENSPIKSETTKIPAHWINKREIQTRTQLLQARKQEFIPDISFDLDGDGVVGPQDYYISKQFCKTNSNKLSSEEKSQAISAMQSGWTNNMLWGLDGSGPTKPYRVIQMRGKIVLNEDFGKVHQTYPKNMSPTPIVASKSQLNEARKQERQELGREYESKREKKFRYNLPINEIISTDWFDNNPQFKTFNEKKEFERSLARSYVGLYKEKDTPRVEFGYQNDPKYRTCSQMKERRKEEMVDVLNKTANYGYVGENERLRMREQEFLGGLLDGEDPKLKFLEKKKNDTAELGNKFSKTVFGVHGCELPKYAENSREYWKIGKDFSDANSELEKTIQSFRENYKKIEKSQEIAVDPHRMVPNIQMTQNPNARNSRWTTYHNNFYQRKIADTKDSPDFKEEIRHKTARVTVTQFRGTHTSIAQRWENKGSLSPGRQTLRSAAFTQ
ncbi:unnamed protein product [Blepharisma stoltei]|uniref:Uncharacterized protein n=1 Tax=Blepharisma stoltei TaxID=1481888 RepID=A0AAU9JVF2_9CILI|nr:unnamed protein product [Blepharisma stoltei]